MILKFSIPNFRRRLTSMVDHSAFNNKLLSLELLSLCNNLKARLYIFSMFPMFCEGAAESQGDSNQNLRM